MQLSLGELNAVVGGQLRLSAMPPREGALTMLGRIVTDSRIVRPGDVFWGLAGKRFDGGLFAEEAQSRGAAGVVASRKVEPWAGGWSLQVNDTLQALQALAAWNRGRFAGSVVAVTGSVGKTTTRQMINAVLSARLTGTASPANYNNHIGVPLSLLSVGASDDYAVIELGASARGEIASLARLCRPACGVITRIGEAHLGGFGSRQAIAESKAELLSALKADGRAVLNGDDPWLRRLAKSLRQRITWVGRGGDCDLTATNVRYTAGRLSFTAAGRNFTAPVWGRHHLIGALAALAVGQTFGIPMSEAADALAGFEAPPMRCEVGDASGATIINDCYNSNPTSMRAALELLSEIEAPGRRIVVSGDMRELGESSAELHERLGDQAVTVGGADWLLACGEHAESMVQGARRAGMPAPRSIACRHANDVQDLLKQIVTTGDAVLVKGSRVLEMQRVVEGMRRAA